MQSIYQNQTVAVCRPLGAQEHIFWLHDQANPFHFAVTAQINGKFNVHQLQQALTVIQQRHPLLRVRIAVDEAEQPWFVEESCAIPVRVVQRQSLQQWQQEVEQEIATPFLWWQAPLVRVVLVHSSNDEQSSELIVICHHAVADGISASYLIRDILQALATPTAFGQSLPIPLSREDLVLDKTLKSISLLEQMLQFSNTSSSFKSRESARPTHASSVNSGSLSSETTLSLLTRCRQEQTSVHAAICAAFLLAIYRQNDSEQLQNLKCTSPINLRPYLTPINQEQVSVCITAGRISQNLSTDVNFWDVARCVKHQLNQIMAPDKLFEELFQSQEWVLSNPTPDAVLQGFKDQFDYDICISNLTRLTIGQEYGELKLQAIYGPVVRTGVESDRFLGVATLGNQLFFTFVAPKSVMKPFSFPENVSTQPETLLQEAIHLLSEAVK